MKIKNDFLRQGLMYFGVGVAVVIAYYAINHMEQVKGVFDTINGILMPFYVGIVVAYLLCPIYNAVVRNVYGRLGQMTRRKELAFKLSRAVGTLIAVGALIILIVTFAFLIIPDLIESIMGLIQGMPAAIERITGWYMDFVEDNPEIGVLLMKYLTPITDNVMGMLETTVVPKIQSIIGELSVGIIGVFGSVLNVFVALMISVYVLNSKEIFQTQAKKFVLATCKPERASEIFEFGFIMNKTFGGFITGKIIDSFIIGVICFIVMNIMGLPLATLISVVVGVTNVIPFFGPFIGAIPSILLLLIIDPWAAVKFAIMVLALQQVDGNIIGPTILGDSTGLASFWVMFAIIVGGGLFGFLGMILGVPVFAVFYIYVSRAVNNKLKTKQLNTDTLYYETFNKYNIDKEEVFGKDGNKDAGAEEAAAQ